MLNQATTLEFEVYIRWLHNRDLVTPPPTGATAPEQNARAEYDQLLRCYDLGHALEDTRFMNAIMTQLVTLLRSGSYPVQLIAVLTLSRVQHFFTAYPIVSPIQKFVVRAAARFANTGEIEAMIGEGYPVEFKNGLVVALEEMRGRDVREGGVGSAAEDFSGEGCWWHYEHEEGEVCPAVGR